jgi:UDP-glucuronate 4-epimerase
MRILVTGCAGFIGFYVCQELLKRGDSIIGIDNLNAYYDVQLKKDRLKILQQHPLFQFSALDIIDSPALQQLFSQYQFTHVIHLAAQAGVRYSLENPQVYIDSNITGTLNILENCRRFPVKHLVYASSSSVYGLNSKMPFAVDDNVDHPISLYAATKKSTELMAHTYSYLFSIPVTGLRFFTVYGPWGRPDMAPMKFIKALCEGKPIDVYNHGQMQRDFTYIDDITIGVLQVLDHPPLANPQWDSHAPNAASSSAPYRLYNIGGNNPVKLLDFIELLEKYAGKKALKNLLPLQPGDVVQTYADMDDFIRDFHFKPVVSLETGLKKFVDWYIDYNGY